jgi:hypothetical protein
MKPSIYDMTFIFLMDKSTAVIEPISPTSSPVDTESSDDIDTMNEILF